MRRPARSLSKTWGTYQGGVAPVLDGTPVWNGPAAGSLGTFAPNTIISQTLSASCPLGGSATYSVVSGALPGGLSLSGSSITGTLTNPAADTTYNFTIRATAPSADYSDRAFSMTVTHANNADPYSGYVYAIYHFDGDYTDATGQGRTLYTQNANSNCGVVTTTSKFGTGSMFSNNTSSLAEIRIPANSNLNAGTGDWCIEFWAKAGAPQQYGDMMQTAAYPVGTTGSTRVVGAVDICNWPTANPGNHTAPAAPLGTGKYLNVQCYDGTNYVNLYSDTTKLATFNDSTWHHVAFCRASGVIYLYIDGVLHDSTTYTGPTDFGSAYGWQFNRWLNSYNSGTNAYNGYIDDFRLTIGAARYTSNFTPPTAAFAYP